MACIKHTPCQHDSHDHNVMIYVEVSRFSANWRAIRSRGCPLDSGKGPVRFVPLSGPKLARRSREQAYGPDHGEILIAREGVRGEKRLVAYVVARAEQASEAPLSAEALHAYLAIKLPEYMVPGVFVQINNRMPILPSYGLSYTRGIRGMADRCCC